MPTDDVDPIARAAAALTNLRRYQPTALAQIQQAERDLAVLRAIRAIRRTLANAPSLTPSDVEKLTRAIDQLSTPTPPPPTKPEESA